MTAILATVVAKGEVKKAWALGIYFEGGQFQQIIGWREKEETKMTPCVFLNNRKKEMGEGKILEDENQIVRFTRALLFNMLAIYNQHHLPEKKSVSFIFFLSRYQVT